MVFRRSRIVPCPPRDRLTSVKGEYMTLEEAVRAYLQGGAVSLPETDDAEFEFPASLPEDAAKGLSKDQLRSDDIAPMSIDRVDLAAGINSQKYAEFFPDHSGVPADIELVATGETDAQE